jgi:4-carboxymuconolactone decarboxylase
MGLAVEDHEETLRKLAIRDDAYIDRIAGDERRNLDESGLDEKTRALVRIAGLIALDAAPTNEEIVGVLVAVLPAVGSGRVVSAAPRLSLALGYDVAAGLEEFGVEPRH